ncbi:hypothetical protein D3C72_1275840 [compost metagenome]
MADHRITFLQLCQLAFQPFTLSGDFVSDILLFQNFQRGQAGRHCELVATESAGVMSRSPGIELFFDTEDGQR